MSGTPPHSALDRPIAVTFFKNYAATEKREEPYTPRALAERIRTITKARKQDLPWLKLATFGDTRTDKNCLRNDENVQAITGIEADYDGEAVGFEEAEERLTKAGVAAILYTSPSHTEDAPRWRVLCPLSDDKPAAAREKMVGRLNGLFGGIFSGESFTLSQSYYFGSLKHNPSHRVVLIEGAPIDEHDDLDEIWRGRPHTEAKPNGSAGPSSGSVDRDALLREIRDGTNYHHAAVRLAGHFARHGVAFMEARTALIDAMEAIPDADRDQRWRSRRADIDRLMEDIYGKEAKKRDAAEAEPEPAQAHRANGADAGQAKPDASALFDPWEDPPPPAWPGNVLSRQAEETLLAASVRDGVDAGVQCLAYLGAASGAAPKDARFEPYPHGGWFVPPIIWVMVIAESGQRKTAIKETAFAPLQIAHGARWSEYMQEIKRWHALSPDDKRAASKPVEPHSFVVNDCTPEKLQLILAATPRGTLLLKDELAGFFEFGRYAGGAGAAERAFYLESYEGTQYTVHRVGRESLHIAVNGLTIYGNIQPDRLAEFKGLESDGLLQRLAVARAKPTVIEQPDVTVPNLRQLHLAIERLSQLDGRNYTNTPAGADLIRQTRREAEGFAEITDYGPGFQGFCRKLHGTHARVALILHLLENPQQNIVPTETIHRAYRLVRHYLLRQALGFYSTIPGSAVALRRDIGGWLLTKAPERVRASDLVHNVKACRQLGAKGIAEVLEPFVIGGWLEPVNEFPTNRAWRLDLSVRSAFAERSEAERTRRAAVRSQIGRIEDGAA